MAKSMFYPGSHLESRIFKASEITGVEKMQIVALEFDIKAADAIHLCHQLVKLPPRPEPERKVENSNYGYAGVFRVNDAKVLHKGKVMRMHQIAGDDPYLSRLSGYRALALEFCKLVGSLRENRRPRRTSCHSAMTLWKNGSHSPTTSGRSTVRGNGSRAPGRTSAMFRRSTIS